MRAAVLGIKMCGIDSIMTADTENLALEHLRHIRARVDQIADDMTDLKLRMSGLESAMMLVKRESPTATKPTPGNKSLSTGWPPAWSGSSAAWS